MAKEARQFDPFRVLSRAEREEHMQRYLRFLEDERDGELDLDGRTLSVRERFFAELDAKPVSWSGEIDYDGFFQHFLAAGKPEIHDLTAWLVAIARSNEGESYGVGLELSQLRKRLARGHAKERAYQHLLLQEYYHCRLLLEACRTCGLDIQFQPPRWPQRFFIRVMQYLPDSLRWIPVICGEVVGTTVFQLLAERTQVFSSDPGVQERLHLLLREIWTDEALHVAYLRAKLSPRALRVAKRLVPLVAAGVLWDVPQFLRLGATRRELMERVRKGLEIPPSLQWIPAD